MRIFGQLFGWMLCAVPAFAQGTFVYDQQSADENHYLDGGLSFGLQPLGQSFTPSLDAVGFIRIYVYGFGSGTFSINLRSDSISGTILSSTLPVTSTVSGPIDCFFQTPVSVTPGMTYYFQPEIQAGFGGWGVYVGPYNYSGGTAFVSGNADSRDFWFREGIVVPEPSSAALLLLGGGFFFWLRKLRKR